jgi:hypothetical protein
LKKSKDTVHGSEDEGELEKVPIVLHSAQSKLNELDEELLELAGAYSPSEVRHSTPLDIPPRSPLSFTDSPLTDLGDWSPVAPEEEERLARDVVEQTVKEVVDELVDTAVSHAGSFGLGIEFGANFDEEAAYQTTTIEQTENDPQKSTGATVETTRTQIKEEVQDNRAIQVGTAVQDTTMALPAVLEEVIPLHAARHVSLDEGYDDDEGFDSA